MAHVLRAAGYEVVFGVANLVSVKPVLNAVGYASIRIPVALPGTKSSFGGSAMGHAEVLLGSGFSDGQQALAGVQAWYSLLVRVQPAAVLVDASPLALYVARCMGLRSMAIGHGFDIPPQNLKPCFAPWTDDAHQRMEAGARELQGVFDQLAVALSGHWGRQVPTSMDDLFDPAHCFLCTWPELDYFDRPGLTPEEASSYEGPIWGAFPGARPHRWPENSREGQRSKVLCYVYLREKHFDLIWQTLAQAGADVLVIAPGASEDVCQAVRAFKVQVINYSVQLGSLLSQCDVVLCQGGMGLVSMALHAGKPLLLLPEYMEHAVLAYRLVRQGLALATARLHDMTVVKDKVERLLGDAQLARAAGALAEKYAGYSPLLAAEHAAFRLLE
ncbi:nucleotide disphospho-sugar-binding domain-containing protein [Rhodoferax sp.]|uniref:glycosyltransferase n=1 Tax=Rhodoferax sp. TaxID=50421 RepID=UPI002610482D|nr:nucleotide disphospho-sugar-binding domain-containing protein [Rhodoferax sp.]